MSGVSLEVRLNDGTKFSFEPSPCIAPYLDRSEDALNMLDKFEQGVAELRAQLLGYIERASSTSDVTDQRNRPKLPPA